MQIQALLPLTLILLSSFSLAVAAPTASAQASPSSIPILRTATTVSGQPLRLPSGATELAATRAIFPANSKTNVHRHPFTRLVYVEQGRLSVTNFDTGTTTLAAEGEMFVEAVGQWHQGSALDGKPARLLVIDLVPPGVINAEGRR